MHSLRRNRGRRREDRAGARGRGGRVGQDGGEGREERGREVDCRLARKKGRRADTEVGREAGGFSTKLRLKVFKECQRAGRCILFLRPPIAPSSSLPTLTSPRPHLFLPLGLTTLSRSAKRKDTSYRSRRTWHLVFTEATPAKIVVPCLKA